MWDSARDDEVAPLTHEMPCPRCGHPPHLFLACGEGCACEPDEMPGERLTSRPCHSVRGTVLTSVVTTSVEG
jgi:hypothetical protein